MEIASARRAGLTVAAAGLLAVTACHRRSPPAPAPATLPTAQLTGQVVDGAHRPVPDAAVLAFGLDGTRQTVRAIADVDGRFKLTAGVGAYRLLVEAAGFPVAARAPVPIPAANLTIALEGEGRTITGTVLRDGAPADGAIVRLAAEAGGPQRHTRTAPDGRFAVSGLGEGTYALRAEAGATSATAGRRPDAAAEVALVSPTIRGAPAALGANSSPLQLALGPAAVVVGRVTEDGALPAGSVEVRAEDRALPPGEDPLPAIARTNGAGAFTLGPLPPGAFRVTAARAGLTLRRTLSIEADARAQAGPITLELLHGARLSGRVTGPAGAAVAGARIRCAGADVDELTVRPGTLPLAAEAAALPGGAAGTLAGAQVAVSDARGRFAVDGLLPGRYRVEVTADGHQPLQLEWLLGPGERRDLGSVALEQGFPVRGRVLDQTGAPLEGARVSASGGSGPLPGATTDAAGQFSLALAPGHYRVTASAEGWGTASADTVAQSGGAQPLVMLRLSRADGAIEGQVRDDAGRPLARARVAARPALAPDDPAVATATTDAGGHFRLARLPAGEIRIEVVHPDYPRIVAPAAAGQLATIVVPMPGGVIGEVRASATRTLVLHARIEASGPDGATAVADTNGTGTFRLLRLAPGVWRIRASAPRLRAAEQQVDVPASPTLGDPSVRDLRIDLDPA